ncbi:conserved hypothetical protein [Burkholderia latens]|uniref:hypothetical protein n=1 Tax=Burkholderia latens TaxID=488446 RepID=UPI0039A57593
MKEIKHTPGPWEVMNGTVNAEDGSVFCIADCYAPSVGPNWSGTDYTGRDYQIANATLIAAAPDMATVLELLAAEADTGKVMIPSALRLTIDAALIKAGRKAAPQPVRHVTIAGGAL